MKSITVRLIYHTIISPVVWALEWALKNLKQIWYEINHI